MSELQCKFASVVEPREIVRGERMAKGIRWPLAREAASFSCALPIFQQFNAQVFRDYFSGTILIRAKPFQEVRLNVPEPPRSASISVSITWNACGEAEPPWRNSPRKCSKQRARTDSR